MILFGVREETSHDPVGSRLKKAARITPAGGFSQTEALSLRVALKIELLIPEQKCRERAEAVRKGDVREPMRERPGNAVGFAGV